MSAQTGTSSTASGRDTSSAPAASAARRPRVLVVSLGRRGGTTQYGWLMARGLAQHADIAVISATTAQNRERWAEIDCRHLEVATFSSVPTMLLSAFAFGRFARIARFAADFAPDVVYYPHGHAWKPILDLILPRAAKTVLTIHDPELHPGEDSMLHRALDAGNRLRVDGYVLLSEWARAGFVARLGLEPARVAVVPLGIFDDLLGSRRELARVAGLEAVLPLAGRYALFVGRIQRYKGLETLLEAYASLPAETAAGIPLVIAGSGDFTERERELLAGVADRGVVVLNRWLDDVEIASLVAAARFVVLPYLSATQSGVIPLASAFGVPAIASQTGGIAEQIVDGDTGLLCAPGDAAALATLLAEAFAMPDHAYAAMSMRCRSHAESAWAWGALAKRLVDFFATLGRAGDRRTRAGTGPS